MLLPVNSTASVLLDFTEFLRRHLPVIVPHIIVMFFNNATIHPAKHVSLALSGYEQQIINYDRFYGDPITIEKSALLINLVNQESLVYIKFVFDKREISVLMLNEEKYFRAMTPNDLAAHLDKKLLWFSTWKPKYGYDSPSKRLTEADLLESYSWLVFVRRANKLPQGSSFHAVDNIKEDSDGVATNELNPTNTQHPIAYASGFKIGIYMIIADKLTATGMGYLSLNSYKLPYDLQFPYLSPIRYPDRRLSWRYLHKNLTQFQHWISFNFFSKANVLINAEPEQFVVLVPRVVDNRYISNQMLYQSFLKFLAVVAFILVAAILSVFRFCCECATNATNSVYSGMYLFVDTFARSLGISPGMWLGRNTSERQLLVIIGFFGLLSSCLFSGFLFENYFVEEPTHFRYNSINDVCLDGLQIGFPISLLNKPDENIIAVNNLK